MYSNCATAINCTPLPCVQAEKWCLVNSIRGRCCTNGEGCVVRVGCSGGCIPVIICSLTLLTAEDTPSKRCLKYKAVLIMTVTKHMLFKIKFTSTEKFPFLIKSVPEEEIDSFCCAILKCATESKACCHMRN